MVDLYVGKIVEDMLKIVFPTYDHTGFGFQCCYTKEQLNDIRRKLVIEIATSKFNTHRIAVFQKSFELPQRRNNPNRKKKKEVKTLFTAPSTKEITKRAEGNKAAEKRKKM
ncbi:hypothetical protein PIB30_017193 [Stylosanthes scabra]|uniref:Uncharacterized protein n=1 Tax=Stylosanthes scabra TaxID=79078 RepID=A0ABU6X6G6_9FABA|nr:hypothetical protein [Stylosanthes scabra]